MMLGGGLFLGLIFLILLIVVIVGLVVGGVWLVGRGGMSNSSQRTGTSPLEEPLEILRRRYAGGEISREEYESIRQDLMT